MSWLLARLKEPSTHASLGLIVALLATFFPKYQELIMAVAGALGISGVVVKETGSQS